MTTFFCVPKSLDCPKHEWMSPWIEKEMRWVAATERAHREVCPRSRTKRKNLEDDVQTLPFKPDDLKTLPFKTVV